MPPAVPAVPVRGVTVPAVFELDAYLKRIGLEGRPSLNELHRSHVTSIPFEGLGPHVGEPVPLDPAALAEKLIAAERGGYCFEQNLLLKAGLEALGYEAEPMLARVLIGASPGEERPRTHLLLRVRDGEQVWHADVGFGAGPLIEPIPWGPGEEHEQLGWRYRVNERDEEFVLQTREGDGWGDVYRFRPEPVPHVDIETSNWFTATHPQSRFVAGLLVSRQLADGRRLILSDWGGELQLVERSPQGGVEASPVEAGELPALLAERFGLRGFALDGEGRLTHEPATGR